MRQRRMIDYSGGYAGSPDYIIPSGYGPTVMSTGGDMPPGPAPASVTEWAPSRSHDQVEDDEDANEATLASLAPEPAPVPIVVTRHAALVDYLREQGVITGEVEVKATVVGEDVRGRRVIGVLPLHLAALAETVTAVDINVPAELRGTELSIDQLRQYAGAITTYVVRVR